MPIPREPPVTRTDRPISRVRGRGRATGADDGISSQPIRRPRLLGLVVLGLRRGVAEIVEQPDLLLAEAPHRVVVGQAVDQLAHARPDLEREVGRRRPDEGLDVVEGRLGHRARKPND